MGSFYLELGNVKNVIFFCYGFIHLIRKGGKGKVVVGLWKGRCGSVSF
jgi:hypothetical protein